MPARHTHISLTLIRTFPLLDRLLLLLLIPLPKDKIEEVEFENRQPEMPFARFAMSINHPLSRWLLDLSLREEVEMRARETPMNSQQAPALTLDSDTDSAGFSLEAS